MVARPKPHRGVAKLTSFVAISLDDANERFELEDAHPDWSLEDLLGEAPAHVFVHDGKVEIDGDLAIAVSGDHAGVYVIEGDLVVGGMLELALADGDLVLRVTGSVRAANLAVIGQAHLWIGKDLKVAGYLVDGMSDGGGLRVEGATTAKAILEVGRGNGRSLAKPTKARIVARTELDPREPAAVAKAIKQGVDPVAKPPAGAKPRRRPYDVIEVPEGTIHSLCELDDRLWAGGPDGLLSFERGKQKPVRHTSPPGTIRNLYPIYGDPDRLAAVGPGGLHLTADGGKTWTRGSTLEGATCLTRRHDSTYFLAGEGGAFATSTSITGPWKAGQLEAGKRAIECINDLVAVGDNILVAHDGLMSTDGKKSKVIAIPVTDCALTRIVRLPSGVLLATGDGRTLLRSSDQGRTWKQIVVPGPAAHFETVRWHANKVYVAGQTTSSGLLLVSTDDGQSFKPIEPAPASKLFALESWGDDLYAAGEGSELYRITG